MLILTRKPKQSIRIGDHITLNVVRVRGNQVQLGIEAPKDVRILRSELVERKADELDGCEAPTKDAATDDEDAEVGCFINLEISQYQEDFESPLQQFLFAP